MAEATKLKIDCSNIYNNYNIIYKNLLRPNSTRKNDKTQFKYTFSLGNVNNNSNFKRKNKMLKNESILPSINNVNRSVSVARQNDSKEPAKKKNTTFELEKLYEQNIGHKSTIKKLQTEIDVLKTDLNKKQTLLNTLNGRIDQMINEKEKENEINIDNSESNQVQGKYIMIKKMKNKIAEAEQYLTKKMYQNKMIKKNIRYTKSMEFEMEKDIVTEQMKKIIKLIETSKDLRKKQEEIILDNKIYNSRIKTQTKLINTFEQKLKELKEEEVYLQNEIIKLESKLNENNNNVSVIKLKHITLKQQNIKLSQEKNDFDNKNKDCTLEQLQKQLSRAKNDFNFYQSKYDSTEKRLNNIKISIEQSKQAEIQSSINNRNGKIEDKLKNIYNQHKDKENDLEKHLFLYQEAIEKMNKGENVDINEIKNKIYEIINRKIEDYDIDELRKGKKKEKGKKNRFDDLSLSDNNPYYINVKENDSTRTNKFTNDQYCQFFYTLFKNLEAKKINKEKAKNTIITPLINYYKEIDNNKDNSFNKGAILQAKLCEKFSEIIKDILNCNNENDLKNLKVYFNAVYFERTNNIKNKDNNSNNMDLFGDYFLSFFTAIRDYTQKDENKYKRKLKTKYKEYLVKLNEVVKNNSASTKEKEKDKEKENNKNYITIQEMKVILDNNKDIKLKERYIEYIIYFMKQFEDDNSSLFDLKIGKIEDILNAEIISNTDTQNINNNENNINDSNIINDSLNMNSNDKDIHDTESNASTEIVAQEEYNTSIDHVLKIIKKLMDEEKKDLRTLFADSIVKMQNPETDIISIDSFRDELFKRNVNINSKRLSCLNKKYCINAELHALDISKIEEDINKLKENIVNDYV